MQTETSLSTTEAEYMALLSENTRTLLPLMDMLEEAKEHELSVYCGGYEWTMNCG
jgi:hypothetical protein